MKTRDLLPAPILSDSTAARQSAEIPHVTVVKDSLSIYLQQVRKIPLLDPEQEMTLALRYRQTGEPHAAGELIMANVRLVVKIAFDFHRRWRISLVDLIQEGNLGLMQGLKRFDPLRGVRFSSYAAYWIKACMLSFIMKSWRMIKIGTSQYEKKLFYNLKKEQSRLERMGLDSGPAQLAATLAEPEDKVVEMQQRLGCSEVSLDVPRSHDRRATCAESLAAPGALLDDHIAHQELHGLLREKLHDFKQGLNARERLVFECRMLAEDPLTLNALSRQFGVSKERIRQIETTIKSRVRTFLQEHIPELAQSTHTWQ